MNIPDEALVVAEDAGHNAYAEGGDPEAVTVASVRAAAPHIAAQTLRDAANQLRSDRGDPWTVGWLEHRANTLDPS